MNGKEVKIMKKSKNIVFLFVFTIIILSAFSCAHAIDKNINSKTYLNNKKTDKNISEHISILPSSLNLIEEEAFAETNLKTISLPDNISCIGDYAFADIDSLETIIIPNKVTYIGKNTFKGSNQLIVLGTTKSYVNAWTEKAGIPFYPIKYKCEYINTNPIIGSISVKQDQYKEKQVLANETIEDRIRTVTGRIIGEQKNKYINLYSFSIRSRSPPIQPSQKFFQIRF